MGRCRICLPPLLSDACRPVPAADGAHAHPEPHHRPGRDGALALAQPLTIPRSLAFPQPVTLTRSLTLALALPGAIS